VSTIRPGRGHQGDRKQGMVRNEVHDKRGGEKERAERTNETDVLVPRKIRSFLCCIVDRVEIHSVRCV